MEQFIYAKVLRHLKKIINQLNRLEAPNELQMNTVTQHATKPSTGKPKPTYHQCRKPSHYRDHCRQLKPEKDQGEGNKSSAGNDNNNNNSGQLNSNFNNKNPNKSSNHNANNRNGSKSKTVYPVGPVAKLTTPQRNSFLELMQQTDRLLLIECRWEESEPTVGHTKQHDWKCPGCHLNLN